MAKNKNDLGVKFGSDEMVFWQQIIDARSIDIKNTENNMKYYKAILEMAEKKFKKAEEEFNKKSL